MNNNETQLYTLIRSKRKSVSLEINKNGELIVRAPFFMPQWSIDIFVAEKQDWIRKTQAKIKERPAEPELTKEELEALRKQAKEFILPRVSEWAKKMGVYPTAVRFTSAKTRWGSCSPKNSVSFSVRLMKKPPEAIEYVIVHELAHITEHNHSARFWNIVARYMPDYKKRRMLLK